MQLFRRYQRKLFPNLATGHGAPCAVSFLLVVSGAAALSCSDGKELPPAFDSESSGIWPGAEKCDSGTSQRCAVTLSRESGRLSCWEGVQTCGADQKWGACEEGEVVERLDPFEPQFSKWFNEQSLSMPVTCGPSNPCDPGCRIFEEPGPFVAGEGEATTEYRVGPTPVWSPPAACAVPDLCTTNSTPLDSGCSACVAEICSQPATDHCCSDGASPTAWDDACVDAVYSVCDMSTPPVDPPNGGFCEFGALAEGSVRFGNGGLSGTTIGSNGVGTEILLESSSPCSYRSIVTRGALNLRNGCRVLGDVRVGRWAYLESHSWVDGEVWVGSDLSLRNYVTVGGGLKVVGDADLESYAFVFGGAHVGGDLVLRGRSSIWGDISVREDLRLHPGAFILGDVFVGGGVQIDDDPGMDEITGNVVAVGDILGEGSVSGVPSADIIGNATVNSGSSIFQYLNVTGSRDETASNVAPLAPDAPGVVVPVVSDLERDLSGSCAQAATMGVMDVSSDTTLTPGIYGAVRVHSPDPTNHIVKLNLLPGEYVFSSLEIPTADLTFDEGSSADPAWDLSTCGDFLGGEDHNFYLTGTTTRPDPAQVIIYSQSSSESAIRFWGENELNAMFIAPKGRIYFGNNNLLGGSLWGDRIHTETSTLLNQGSTSDCERTGLWGATCLGYSLYADGSTYAVDDEVHTGGTAYRCIDAAYCSAGGGYDGATGYWPGQGASWGVAWQVIAPCTVPDLPDHEEPRECPIQPVAYEPLYASPCASGRDCQANSRCEEAATGAGCAHAKCELGGFLSLGCDPCVDLICDPDGDGSTTDPCCLDAGSGSEWDASCIARVASECDASCGETAQGCEHDVCVTGGGMVQNSTCSDCVADVCSVLPACCTEDGDPLTEEWGADCVELASFSCGTPGSSICDYGAFGAYDLETGDSLRVVGGAIGGDSDGTHSLDYDSSVEDIFSFGNAYIYGSTVGDAYATGAITADSTSSVSSQSPNQLMTAPSIPTKSFACGASPADDEDFGTGGGVHELAPGSYGDVSLGAGELRLTGGGAYNIQSLTLGSDTKLRIEPGALVELNLCENFVFDSGVEFVADSGPALVTSDALRIRIHANGVSPNDSTIGSRSTIFAVITAPASRVGMTALSAHTGVTLHGMVRARRTSIHDYTEVISTGLTGAACHSAGLGETGPTPACTANTPTSDVTPDSGECIENEHGYVDASCGGVDLALGAPCEESIPICNHGASDFSGSVDLSFWPENASMMATELPDPRYLLGTCPFSGDIPAGGCVSHDCSATGFMDRDMTVMVNAPSGGTFAVSECSVLDNWTLFTVGQSCTDVCTSPPCIAADAPVQFVEEYTASCPAAMAPLWSSLAWNAETPGASTVAFEASTTAPPMASYSLLGSSDIDGEDCSLFGPSPCPIDITDELSLGMSNHPDSIYLRVTLTPVGGDIATLHDWDVTYTCVFDE